MSSSFSSKRARRLLRELTGDSEAAFRDDQLEVIQQLVDNRGRVLLVQRTGWGKSAVYFIATKLLRDAGLGPTLLISPLIALMRNQEAAAARIGIRAVSIHSSNTDEWEAIGDQIDADEVDVLLISPERLANQGFRDEVLPKVASRCGLLVIDEAHCISDWGHDFRPDYRRLVRVLDVLPSGVPVLCCTATANDRVIEDVTAQLGTEFETTRGPLGRSGLRLHALTLPAQAERLTWLVKALKLLPGTGIIYCATVPDTWRVADWLTSQGISATAYSGDTDPDERPRIEQRLLDNDVKVVVATSALGMGFDKPDLTFVIHYQSPGSAIAYYQQVGRAGRGVSESWGILLRGAEDADIQNYFIDTAFPDPGLAIRVIDLMEERHEPMRVSELLSEVNITSGRLNNLLKNLEVDLAVERVGSKWQRTLHPWSFDYERVEAVTAQRRAELEQSDEYLSADTCRMKLLLGYLDDPSPSACGVCDNCSGESVKFELDETDVQKAVKFTRRGEMAIAPRKRMPVGGPIPPELQLAEGRSLSRWADGGWGTLVRQGKQNDGRFDDRLVRASTKLIRKRWQPEPAPTWVTFVPSLRNPELVPEFARRLAGALGLPCQDVIVRTRAGSPQKAMQNSQQQFRNVADAFEVRYSVPHGPVLLVDDVVDSRWTLTAIGQRLREAGSGEVFPFALADSAGRSSQ